MKHLPSADQALLLRTDFSSDTAWTALCDAVRQPSAEGFQARILCVDDHSYDGLTTDQIIGLATSGTACPSYVFVADAVTFGDPDQPVQVIDLLDVPGRSFRVIPRAIWSVENNLSLGNMDYSEFAESVDADGVFRGFQDL